MPKPVYALVGADNFLQLQTLARIAGEFSADAQRVDFEGETVELAAVLDELRSFSMFGGGEKIVVVRDADAFVSRFREQLEDYVAKPSDSASLVLRLSSLPSNQRIYKAIDKVGEIVSCAPPKDPAGWVVKHAKDAHGLRVPPDAARLLVDLIGNDLGRLDNELAKLALSSPDGRIDDAAVSGAVAFQRERQMWDMTDELGAGRPTEALRRWRQLVALDPSSEFRAVTWLAIWLENVRRALAMKRSGANAFTICKELRIWPRERQEPFLRTCDALGEAGVNRAIDELTEVDRQSKSGIGDAATNVERFILSLAARQV